MTETEEMWEDVDRAVSAGLCPTCFVELVQDGKYLQCPKGYYAQTEYHGAN